MQAATVWVWWAPSCSPTAHPQVNKLTDEYLFPLIYTVLSSFSIPVMKFKIDLSLKRSEKKLQNHVIFYPNNPLVYVFNTLWDPFLAMLVSHWHQHEGKNTVFFGQS